MQKVEGSSPFIRLNRKLRSGRCRRPNVKVSRYHSAVPLETRLTRIVGDVAHSWPDAQGGRPLLAVDFRSREDAHGVGSELGDRRRASSSSWPTSASRVAQRLRRHQPLRRSSPPRRPPGPPRADPGPDRRRHRSHPGPCLKPRTPGRPLPVHPAELRQRASASRSQSSGTRSSDARPHWKTRPRDAQVFHQAATIATWVNPARVAFLMEPVQQRR